jgi:hypothetical protein
MNEYLSTAEAATALGIKADKLRAFVSKHPTLGPGKILGRLAWTQVRVVKVREMMSMIQRGLCIHCGEPWCGAEPPQEPPEPASESGEARP